MVGLTFIIIISNLINLISGIPIVTITSRWGHSATLVNSKIYFIGGRTEGNVPVTEFLSLDVSKQFSSLQPEWNLSDTVGIPKTIGHTAVRGGLDNNQIIIFGGSVNDPATALTDSLFVFDTISGLLTNPQVPPATNGLKGPGRRYEHSAVIGPTGEMLIYGGMIDQSTGSENLATLQDLWKLETSTTPFNPWLEFPLINSSPGLRTSHTASVVGSKMIIIGGMTGDVPRGMNVIYVFDLNTNKWQVNTATGEIPESRREHSAVVANNNIIIYGGTDATRSILYGDVAILDINTWSWTIQDTINPPKKRRGHSATLVGANMIVAFGRTDISADPNIYILNILNWAWINQYIPTDLPYDNGITTTSPTGNITNPNPEVDYSRDKTILYLNIIIFLAVLCGLLIVMIVSYIIHRIIDQRRIDNGTYLLSIPYEANPLQPPPQTQPTPPPPMVVRDKPRPAFLCLGKSKKQKHESAEGLFNPSVPTSPSSGPSTPQTNTTRFSNGSGIGPPKNVRFSNNTITLHQYSPESDISTQSPLDIERETESIKDRLGANNLTPRPSIESIDNRYSRILVITNPDREDYERDHNDDGKDRDDDDDREEDEDEDYEEIDLEEKGSEKKDQEK